MVRRCARLHVTAAKLAAVLVVAALPACGTVGVAKKDTSPPAVVRRVKGTSQPLVIVTPRAAQRVGVTLATIVAISAAKGGGTAVPYSAVLYFPDGSTWVYESVKAFTYQRARITVDGIAGDWAYLSASPSAGTPVVSVGASEVYGTEFFSGHE